MDEIEKVTVTDVTVDQLCDDAAKELCMISLSSNHALTVITQAIRTQEAVEKGKVLYRLKKSIPYGYWMKFIERADVRMSNRTACDYMDAYELVSNTYSDSSPEVLRSLPIQILASLKKMPSSARLDVISEIEGGKKYTVKELERHRSKPEIRLEKCHEDLPGIQHKLDLAEQEFSRVSSDPSIKSWDQEYMDAKNKKLNAVKSETSLLNTIKLLEGQLADENSKASELQETLSHQEDQLAITTTKLNAVQEELDKMKFDDEISIGLMVKRTGYNLQNMVPQVLADVQRFDSAKDRFPDELAKFLEEQITQLTSYLKTHYAN